MLYRLYSPKIWEFRTICQLVTWDACRPCMGLGLRSYTNNYCFSQKVAVGQAGLYDCKSCTFIGFGSLFVRVFDNVCYVQSTFVAAVAEWYGYRTVACLVTSSSPVPLKTHRVGQRCTLNLSRAETSSRWCGVVVRRGGASSGVVHVT
ncbi:uncharacterized protein TNCV_4435041 [Trichonephila clavipes]|nr:uncharacterized protein TNCV_4435041 [Trichonephila clavipes]